MAGQRQQQLVLGPLLRVLVLVLVLVQLLLVEVVVVWVCSQQAEMGRSNRSPCRP